MSNQIDTSIVIKDYQGEDIVKSFLQGEEPKPITIRKLIQFAMNNTIQGDEAADFKKKLDWHNIAEKAEQPIITYSAREITTILERGGKIYTALIFGRLKEVIDPEPAA